MSPQDYSSWPTTGFCRRQLRLPQRYRADKPTTRPDIVKFSLVRDKTVRTAEFASTWMWNRERHTNTDDNTNKQHASATEPVRCGRSKDHKCAVCGSDTHEFIHQTQSKDTDRSKTFERSKTGMTFSAISIGAQLKYLNAAPRPPNTLTSTLQAGRELVRERFA